MNEKLILLLFLFSFVQLETASYSEVLWSKFLEYVNGGEKIYLASPFYFIFDESNYTNYHVNHTKMQALYDLQKNYYIKRGIRNYIFLFDTTGSQKIESFAKDISKYIAKEFSQDLSNSVITLIPIQDRLIRIELGASTNSKYVDENLDIIINNLGPYMRSEDYYGACKKLMNDLESYYGKEYKGGGSSSGSSSSSSSFGSKILSVFKIILIIIVILGICVLSIYCSKNGYCETSGYSSSYVEYGSGGHHHHHSPHFHSGGGGHRSGGGGGGHHSGGRTGGW